MLKSFLTIFIVFFILITFSSIVHPQDWGKISDEEWALQPPEKYPEANAVILFDKCILEVSIDGITSSHHVRIKIFNEAGADEAGDWDFYYRDGDKISKFKAHTITPNGKKHKVNKKNVHTKSFGSNKMKSFSFPAIENGSIVELKYNNYNKKFSSLKPWYFQNDLYTMESSFSLKLIGGFTYSSVTNNIRGSARNPASETNKFNKSSTYKWTLKNLMPIKDEPYAGAFKNFTASLHYQLVSYQDQYQLIKFIDDWLDLGEFFTNKVIKRYCDNSKGIDKLVKRLINDSLSKNDRVKNLYQYVCDSIKTKRDDNNNYFSSDNIKKLLDAGYGTSDEKNILLIEMAKEAGFSVWPILICTRSHGIFNPEINQLSQFNHLLAYVEIDSGGVFLDATNQFCPFGMLPPNCLVNGGFLLDGKNSRIVKLVTKEFNNYRLDNTIINIDSNGIAQCTTTTDLSGYFNPHYGNIYESEDPKDFIDDYFIGVACDDYELLNHSFEKDKQTNRGKLIMEYSTSELIDQIENNLLITPPIFRFNKNPFTDDSRIYPVDFDFPFTIHCIVKINTDNSVVSVQLPKDLSIKMEGGSYTKVSRKVETAVIVETKLKLTHDLYPPSHYQIIKEFFDKIEQANTEQVVLVLN